MTARTATSARPAAPARTARTLAADLRARDDEALLRLLRLRPDLLSPVPGDLTQLATRAGTRASVLRALEHLDRFSLQVAEILAILPDGSELTDAGRLLTGDGSTGSTGDGTAASAALPAAVRGLRDAALVWGEDTELHLVRTARDLLGPAGVSTSTAATSAAAAGPGWLATAGLGPSLAESLAQLAPSRIQEILADLQLPPTADAVGAAAAIGALLADPARFTALLADAPEAAHGALRELVWGPPTGAVADADRPVRAADARTGIEWLLARGLLLPAGPSAVLLPREIALRLRGGRAHRRAEAEPPPAEAVRRNADMVGKVAAGQAFAALRIVEELLESWNTGGPPVLRSGGLGVREVRRVAQVLNVPEQQAPFWLELAHTAGLIAPNGEVDEVWLLTPAYDDWLGLPPERRWARLAAAWLRATRVPELVGLRDSKGRTLNALAPELDRSAAPEVRLGVLAELATVPAGDAIPPERIAARLRWRRPLRGAGPAVTAASVPVPVPVPMPAPVPADGAPAGGRPGETAAPQPAQFREELVRWAITQAELLGLTGRGALAAHGRALLASTGGPSAAVPTASGPATTEPTAAEPTAAQQSAAERAAAARLAPLLPEPLNRVLLQADLTAVAPGPLTPELGRRLGLAADIESKGGATVYRFTPASVRRALDAGMTAAELQSFLTEHSTTEVPQPLHYLVDDVARRHGLLRVGAAGSYLRCDDDALLTELLTDRRAAPLQLTRLAPTVLAAQAAPDTVLAKLRAIGYAPAAESAGGQVLITRADARRSAGRRPPEPVHEGPPAPDEAMLATAVRTVRAGDEASTALPSAASASPNASAATGSGELPPTTAAEALATVQTAVLTGRQLLIGYVNPEGRATRRVIEPARVQGGFVTAYDHLTDTVHTFALHRLTGIAELDPTAGQ